ncbi:MAG TPA: tetratricopeptide repeat protein [Flavisolibacter sp.]|nr:tetratricopeptide repeat protein [Flavisolibacter sp.]
MQRNKLVILAILFLALTQKTFAQDELDKYLTRLRISQAVDGRQTASMTSGSFFLYGQGYFDNKNYTAAAHFFKDALAKDPRNACASYQMAISLIRQNDPNKTQQAQKYLERAFAIYPSLKERLAKDVATAATAGYPAEDAEEKKATSIK